MSTDVISHHAPRRKREPSPRRDKRVRGSWWGYFARRFGALVVTIIALGVASLIAPLIGQPVPEAPPIVVEATPAPEIEPSLLEIDVALDLAAPPPAPRRARQVRSRITLDAAGDLIPDDYEILSASELDAISQARN